MWELLPKSWAYRFVPLVPPFVAPTLDIQQFVKLCVWQKHPVH
jgi:hypothetical protein